MGERLSLPARLPSLDGMRAVAIGIVMLAHAIYSEGAPGWLQAVSRALPGAVGVQIFFVISGFIITHLMLREHEKLGGIRLGMFWVRRAFRILPPIFVLLFTLQVLDHFGWLRVTGATQWASLLFYQNHVGGVWFNSHLWSVSVEEQFYLAWPLVTVWALSRGQAIWFVPLVVAAPVVRALIAAGWLPLPEGVLLAHLDGLMLGGWAAWHVAGKAPMPARWVAWLQRNWLWLCPLVAILCWAKRTRWYAAGMVVEPLLVSAITAVLILQQTQKNATWLYALLNQPWLARLGTMSYSLYLWQQLFLSPAGFWLHSPGLLATFPFNIGASLLAGWLSYRLVETPFARLRSRFA
jgi:peptidoglycan/LPS O-acetylase OafA/YrhL